MFWPKVPNFSNLDFEMHPPKWDHYETFPPWEPSLGGGYPPRTQTKRAKTAPGQKKGKEHQKTPTVRTGGLTLPSIQETCSVR